MGAAQSWPAPFPILSWKASPTSMQSSAYLHPSRAANVQQGVREIINSLLLRKVFLLFSVSRFVCFLFGKFDFSFCGAGEHLQRANR
jgi:hypothetical protein